MKRSQEEHSWEEEHFASAKALRQEGASVPWRVISGGVMWLESI